MRDYKLQLDDILQSIHKIQKYTRRKTLKQFQKNELLLDAVVRNLEIIGEAAKHLPDGFKDDVCDIEWKKLAGLRNIHIH
jgi:uncharacterized protein with HEPN domain